MNQPPSSTGLAARPDRPSGGPPAGRDVMIQEYIQQARARLEATSASAAAISARQHNPASSPAATSSPSANPPVMIPSQNNFAKKNPSQHDVYREMPPGRQYPFKTPSGPTTRDVPQDGEWPLPSRGNNEPPSQHRYPPGGSRFGGPANRPPRNNNYAMFAPQSIRGPNDYQARNRDFIPGIGQDRGYVGHERYAGPPPRGLTGQPMYNNVTETNPATPTELLQPQNFQQRPNFPTSQRGYPPPRFNASQQPHTPQNIRTRPDVAPSGNINPATNINAPSRNHRQQDISLAPNSHSQQGTNPSTISYPQLNPNAPLPIDVDPSQGSGPLHDYTQHSIHSTKPPGAPGGGTPAPGTHPAPPPASGMISLPRSAQMPAVPVIPEEAGSRGSFRSSAASSNATDLLYEGSENGRVNSGISDFLDGYRDQNSPAPDAESPGVELVREASVSQVQKPILRQLSVTQKQDRDSDVVPGSVPGIVIEEAPPSDDFDKSNGSSPQIVVTQEADDDHTNHTQSKTVPSINAEPIRSSYHQETPQDMTSPRLSTHQSRSTSPLLPGATRFSQNGGGVGLGLAASGSQGASNATSEETTKNGEERAKSQYLDVLAMSDEDTRASMTSLKGLILRNLKLASNLERGVTSSRFGLDWILNAQESDMKPHSRDSRASMLDMFPTTPMHGSPQPDQGQSPMVAWGEMPPSPMAGQEKRSTRKRRKQCCGLPTWAFVLCIVIVILLVVAAIIIPLALIVIPGQNQGNPQPASRSPTGLDQCRETMHCHNGGLHTLSATDSICRCICVDGWAGSTCNKPSSRNCVTMDLPRVANVTAGSAIPRLITKASKRFNIALDGIIVLSLMSEADMTCKSENDFVSFDILPSRDTLYFPPLNAREERQPGVATTMGIVYARSTPVTVATQPTGIPDPGNAFDPRSERTLDFASTAILYILQTTAKPTTGKSAHSSFQRYFVEPQVGDPRYLDLGYGWRANLIATRVWYAGV